jgi:hypothetical protein
MFNARNGAGQEATVRDATTVRRCRLRTGRHGRDRRDGQNKERNPWPLDALEDPMGTRASSGIDVGTRVVANQQLPEGIAAGAKGIVVGQAGWIQRRWRVRFDDGTTVNVPEYALRAHRGRGRFRRA